MIYEMVNASFLINEDSGEVTQNPLPTLSNNDICIGCNFAQFEDTEVFQGLTGLKFIDCNLMNCELPLDSEVDEGSNTAQIAFEVENV
ncbi:MAG: hypothetical protein GY861_11295 [bacterium]|nr:hypothetical protein [bacterium]